MKDCIFCKIIRGEMPSYKVYEDDSVIAILDIFPVNDGHTLIIPKHMESRNIFDIPEDIWLKMAKATQVVAKAVEKALNTDGVNIAMNNREHAGQVIDHPHLHIIPRFKGDGLKLMPQRKYKEGEASGVQEKIVAALKN